MRQLLAKKGFDTELIDDTIPQLEKSWYLDDTAYTRAYLNSEVARKGKPLLLIKQKLLTKWVDKQLLEELIEDMDADIQEGQATKIAKEIVRLRDKGKTDPEIVQTLTRKWFDYMMIRTALTSTD